MAWRPLSLTATTMLAAAVLAGADTPTTAPSPAPSSSTRAAANPKRSGGPASKTASPSPEPSKAPGHVFTNEDLPAQPSPPVIASPGPAGTGRGTVTVLPKTPGATPPPSLAASEETGTAETEALWRARMRVPRDSIAAAEKEILALEDRIAALRNDRSPTNLMDPNREQTRQTEIAKAQADLERTRGDIERFRKALADFEEEARRKGIPPGWLSER